MATIDDIIEELFDKLEELFKGTVSIDWERDERHLRICKSKYLQTFTFTIEAEYNETLDDIPITVTEG